VERFSQFRQEWLQFRQRLWLILNEKKGNAEAETNHWCFDDGGSCFVNSIVKHSPHATILPQSSRAASGNLAGINPEFGAENLAIGGWGPVVASTPHWSPSCYLDQMNTPPKFLGPHSDRTAVP